MAFHFSPNLVTKDLAFMVDAANDRSRVSDTKWSNLLEDANHFTFYDGNTADSTVVYDTDNLGSFDFSGNQQHFRLSYTGDFTTNSYTYMFFAKSDVINERRTFVGFSDSEAPSGTHAYYCHNLQHWDGDDQIVSFLSSGAGYSSFSRNVGVDFREWNFYCVAITPTNVKLIVNSTVFDIGGSPSVRNNFDQIWIGTRNPPNDQNFNGKISNFMLYERELSEDEISQNFNALKSRYGL